MFGLNDVDKLRQKLEGITGEIAANPLSSEEVRRANDLVDQLKEQGLPADAIDGRLTQEGLPTTQDLGRLMARHLIGLTGLNKKRAKLEARIAKLGG